MTFIYILNIFFKKIELIVFHTLYVVFESFTDVVKISLHINHRTNFFEYLSLDTFYGANYMISFYVISLSLYILECDDNYYGINCKERCSDTCINCSRKTGVCQNGCRPGWKGMYCNEGERNINYMI